MDLTAQVELEVTLLALGELVPPPQKKTNQIGKIKQKLDLLRRSNAQVTFSSCHGLEELCLREHFELNMCTGTSSYTEGIFATHLCIFKRM